MLPFCLNDITSLVRFSDAYDEMGKNVFREAEYLRRVLSPEGAYHTGRETLLMNRQRYRHCAYPDVPLELRRVAELLFVYADNDERGRSVSLRRQVKLRGERRPISSSAEPP